MIPHIIATLFLAGTRLAQNIDSRIDQIVQFYATSKNFSGSVLLIIASGAGVLGLASFGRSGQSQLYRWTP